MPSGRRFSYEEFKLISSSIHNHLYIYSEHEFNQRNSDGKIKIGCPFHGDFWQKPSVHMKGIGCFGCASIKRAIPKKLTLEKFIQLSKEKHNNFYDYTNTILGKNNREKVEIMCPQHGTFWQSSGHHLRGIGCPVCGRIKTINSHLLTFSEFLTRAKIVHLDKYDYSCTDWNELSSDGKISIICPKHGIFRQKPLIHVSSKAGCTTCGNENSKKALTMTVETFVSRAKEIHECFYEYDLNSFKSATKHVTIICPKHGNFFQKAYVHLSGSRCPKCQSRWVKQDLWLDYMGLPKSSENRQVRLPVSKTKSYVVDGYLPSKNVVYEFYGDFWHGNPEKYDQNEVHSVASATYGELYQKTIQRANMIRCAGYNLIEIWEKEWDIIVEATKRKEVIEWLTPEPLEKQKPA